MRAPGPFAEAEGEAFTVVSRGDLVEGRLLLGSARGPSPLVVVTPALGSDRCACSVATLCRALRQAGLSAAAIDLPLQGERASAKLSDRLVRSATQRERADADRLLWEEFLRQSAHDLSATCAALARRPEIRGERIGCVAFEPGAEAAAAWAARDARVRICLAVATDVDPERIARQLREQLA